MIRNIYSLSVFLVLITTPFYLLSQEEKVYHWEGEKARYDFPLARVNKFYDQELSISLRISLLHKKLGVRSVDRLDVIDTGFFIPSSLELKFQSLQASNPDRFVVKIKVYGKVGQEPLFIPLAFSMHVSDTMGISKNVRLSIGKISIDTYESVSKIGGDIPIESNKKLLDKVNITPNPFTEGAYISFESQSLDPLSFVVYDILGNKVYAKVLRPGLGLNRIWFDPKLPRGLYIYKIENDHISVAKRFVIN